MVRCKRIIIPLLLHKYGVEMFPNFLKNLGRIAPCWGISHQEFLVLWGSIFEQIEPSVQGHTHRVFLHGSLEIELESSSRIRRRHYAEHCPDVLLIALWVNGKVLSRKVYCFDQKSENLFGVWQSFRQSFRHDGRCS